jgi:sulfate adenylyltransferase subunit 2
LSDQISDLMCRAERLAERERLSLSTISRKLLNDGKGLSRLKAGGQLTIKTMETALSRLAALERGLNPDDMTITRLSGPPPGIERKFLRPPPEGAGGARTMSHLDRLEAEAIHIMREVAAEAEHPVMLYSIGKDSSVMLHLASKAFYPSRPPFSLMHVDTTWKFKDMYAHRDRIAKELGFDLIVYVNEDGLKQGIGPFTHGSAIHTDVMKTQALKQALDKYKFDVAFGGARRDEEKSRAKERIFSFRSAQHRWDPKNQRPELWSIYNTRIMKGESIRVFPISNWTELDIWQYIYRENIPIPSLYFARERPIVERDGALIMVDDGRMPLAKGEKPKMEMVRFRTLGCYPLTGAVRSTASTLPEVIQEMLLTTTSERQGRVIDHDQSASMEKKKQEGYF